MLPLPLAEGLVETWTKTKISLAGNYEKPALAAQAVAWATEVQVHDPQHVASDEFAKQAQVNAGTMKLAAALLDNFESAHAA